MGISEHLCIATCLFVCCLYSVVLAAPGCHRSANSISSVECPKGSFIDRCNNRVCFKGPGEMCMGRIGTSECVFGTYCHRCGQCVGCSYIKKRLRCIFTCR